MSNFKVKSNNLAGKEFKVDSSTQAFQTRYRDENIFYSKACKFPFERNPEKYLNSPQ